MKFWSQRCYLETPLVLIFHLMGLITIIYLLAYALLAANYGSFSQRGSTGYLLFIACTGLYLIAVVWVAYFFHIHSRRHYEQRRIIGKTFFLFLVYLVGMGSAYCLMHYPSKRDMQDYVRSSVIRSSGSTSEIPGILRLLQTERKCCGIEDFNDYIHPLARAKLKLIDFPDSCCKVITPNCALRLNVSSSQITSVIHKQGCIIKEISEIKLTKAYHQKKLIKLYALIPITFPLATIVLMQVVICITRPKNELPQLPESCAPSRKSSWERGPSEVHFVFHAETVIPSEENHEPDLGSSGDVNTTISVDVIKEEQVNVT